MVYSIVPEKNYNSSLFNIPDVERDREVVRRATELIDRHQRSGDQYSVPFRNIQLKMKQGVLCAAYGDGSQVLSNYVSVSPTDTVLDMGTGSGAMAILAAQQGAYVTAVDISPLAVACAKENVLLNDVENTVEVFQSDLFSMLEGRKFSSIFFNPPFMNGKPKNLLEVAMYDEGYQKLTQFFKEVKDYLLPGGRLTLVFSEAGDMNYLEYKRCIRILWKS